MGLRMSTPDYHTPGGGRLFIWIVPIAVDPHYLGVTNLINQVYHSGFEINHSSSMGIVDGMWSCGSGTAVLSPRASMWTD